MVFIYSSSVTTLTFQFNAMLVSQVEDIVSHFSFHRDPLAWPIYIHHVDTEQKTSNY